MLFVWCFEGFESGVCAQSTSRLLSSLLHCSWNRQAKEGYLQGQIGNPDGEDKPNKKFYDPRVWIRKVSYIVSSFPSLASLR